MSCIRYTLFTFFCTISLLFSKLGHAQDMQASLTNYAANYTVEKAYLHYDKALYARGDTIWYKAYVLAELYPAEKSKGFYIDFIDDKGKLIQHRSAPLINGSTSGQMDIPEGYTGNYIRVRAYTRWMLNFDSTFLYSKDIPLIQKGKINPVVEKAKPTITFLPESGDLVAGITTKVAFKAHDQWGTPVSVKGVLLSAKGEKLDSVKSVHDGMGFFFVNGAANEKYTVKWKDEDNKEYTSNLPAIKNSGANITIVNDASSKKFAITLSNDLKQANDEVHLVGSIQQNPVFVISKSTKDAQITGTIPVNNLPSGVLTISLFNKNWQLLAERIAFINNKEYAIPTQFEVQHWGLNKRAKNEIKIAIPDEIVADLSIAVTDFEITRDSSNNIISHLLLSSELRGDIYRPSFYFTGEEDKNPLLDLVMLTHGWRKINWNSVVNKTPLPTPYGRDTSFLTLSGKVQGITPAMLGNNAGLSLILDQKNTGQQFLFTDINNKGEFDLNEVLFDSAKVYFQLNGKGARVPTLQFFPNKLAMPTINKIPTLLYFPPTDTAGSYHQWLAINSLNELAEKEKIKTLENVTVEAKRKSVLEQMDEKYARGLFSGGINARSFDLINDPSAVSAMNIFMYLQSRVAGLQISGMGANTSLSWRGGTPTLYVDEMQSDVDMVSSMPVTDIAYIKVFPPPFMGGFGGGSGGAIAVYTRRGDDVARNTGGGLPSVSIMGYSPIRAFYSPNYANILPEHDAADLRTTLYWNPQVILTPQEKQVVLPFYNNDFSQGFRVIIQGMTSDGRLIHKEEIME